MKHMHTPNHALPIDLPKEACVYFLSDKKGDVIYVGKALTPSKLMNRLYFHGSEKGFSSVHFIEYGLKDLYVAELRWILNLKPIHNHVLDHPERVGLVSSKALKDACLAKGAKLSLIKSAYCAQGRRIEYVGTLPYFGKDILDLIKS